MDLLVLSGGNHPYEETTPLLEEFLKAAGHSLQVTEDAAVLTSDGVEGMDALVFNTLRIDDLALARDEQAALKRLVGEGTGFVCLHISGCLPEGWPEYHDMTGGGWIMGTSTHPPYGQFEVNVKNEAHPCAEGIGEFVTNDELYTKIGWKPGNDVFLTADLEGETYPMAWTRSYGGGRVFNTVLGHNGLSFRTPEVQRLVLNGIQWAVSGG